MANTVRIKRRTSGNAGAPTTLKSGELAYNNIDNTIYAGFGDDGAGNATSIKPVGGEGSFALLASPAFTGSPTAPTQTSTDNSTKLATTAFVKTVVSASGGGDMLKSVYDTNDDGKVNAAVNADAVPWTGVTGKPSTFTPAAHSHTIAEVTSLQTTLDAKAPLASPTFTGTVTLPATTAIGTITSTELGYVDGVTSSIQTQLNNKAAASHTHATSEVTGLDTALAAKAPLASPALTGTPTAPTATSGTSTTQIATTAFVSSAISTLVNGSPAALDTLNELAAALGNDANFSTTITTSISEKLAKASNLSDLTNTGTARTNLGLGTMATQNASAVAITGGTIDNITLDGGTF